VRLLLVLTNNWRDFGGAEAVLAMVAAGEGLPKNAFWSDPRAIEAQLAYQRALSARINTVNGQRYAEDDTIFAWELANEARCEERITPALCDAQTLARWASTMAEGLRASGVLQPIAWGGSGYLGEHGEDLRSIAQTGAVDILTMHLYANDVRAPSPAPRFEVAMAFGALAIRQRAQVARDAGLPLLLEELNWKPEHTSDRDGERATVLAHWLEVAREEQVAALPWMIGEEGRTDYDGYLVRPSDTASVHALRCQ
jgi:mannan endo-1,4-beta-mannosidase